jgi:hypothetical protein
VYTRGVAPVLGALTIVLLVALGGCGGNDDETTAGADNSGGVIVESTSMTKPEYVAKANQICTQETDKVLVIVRKAIGSGSKVKVGVVLPPVEEMADRLTAMGAPKGEEAQVEAFLTTLEENLEKAKDRPRASTDALATTFKPSGDLAGELGIEACRLG